MPSIDVDNEFLELFYNITNKNVPDTLDGNSLKAQLAEVVEVMKEINSTAKKPYASKALGTFEENDGDLGPAILVVDDLGVITYQLKVLLSKFECDIDCSQEIYDAVNKYKRRKYKYIVMDLFIPTEREGFILLTELKKMANASGNNIIIGVITASPRKEIEQQCKARGADFFLEKNNDWQNSLLEIMDEYINVGKQDEDDF